MRAKSGALSENTNVAVSVGEPPDCARVRDRRPRKSRTGSHAAPPIDSMPEAVAAGNSANISVHCDLRSACEIEPRSGCALIHSRKRDMAAGLGLADVEIIGMVSE